MKLRMSFLFFFLIIYSSHVFGQENESWMIYDDSEVARIDITMDPNNLEWMFDNPEIDSMHLAQVHFKNGLIDEVVDSVGIRIRGNTSRISYKKSIKLSFNTFIPRGDFYSLEKMNLNGEHNDPSIVRSKLCWDFFNSIGVIASRAAHATVYINDKYYGLYISVEHIDEEFLQKNYSDDSGNLWKCLFGSSLSYIGNDPNLYKIENNDGSRPYDLIRNEEIDDYSQLARLIDIINNTANNVFEDSLESILNVNGVLKYLAANILVGGWDDYWSLSNNYYLYHNPTTDRFDLIPYDYDNTFGITWWDIDWASVNPYSFAQIVPGPRPLVDRMLQFPKYRNLFSHFLKYYSDNYFNTPSFYSKLNLHKTQIQSYAELDTFRLVDWGFTYDDFLNSFDQTGYYYQNGIIVPNSIKGFVESRTSALNSQINFIDTSPIIYDLNFSNTRLVQDEELMVETSVHSYKGINSVKLELVIDNEDTVYIDMDYTPIENSHQVEKSDLWSVTVPPFGESKMVFLKIIAADNSGGITSYPKKGIQFITASPVSNEILINELMSVNTSIISDEMGEFDDWMELYNPQADAVELSGKYLTDKKDNLTKWQFPEGLIINPNEYKIIWCDEDQEQGENHINFKLSSNGEFIVLVDTDGISIIDSITIPPLIDDQSFARNSDNSWQITSSPSPGFDNIITDLDYQIKNQYQFKLEAYPNPFNPSTVISFGIARPMNVKLAIFDILGRQVWSTDKQRKEVGNYSVTWNGIDNQGKELVSGIYFVQIAGESYSKTLKLMLLR